MKKKMRYGMLQDTFHEQYVKKIAKSSNPAKQCIMLCLDDMLQSETEDHESDNWIKLVDRGGLNHVSNAMYMAIVSMHGA